LEAVKEHLQVNTQQILSVCWNMCIWFYNNDPFSVSLVTSDQWGSLLLYIPLFCISGNYSHVLVPRSLLGFHYFLLWYQDAFFTQACDLVCMQLLWIMTLESNLVTTICIIWCQILGLYLLWMHSVMKDVLGSSWMVWCAVTSTFRKTLKMRWTRWGLCILFVQVCSMQCFGLFILCNLIFFS
jgi:hypothetical protein